jgi:hypothetical protein
LILEAANYDPLRAQEIEKELSFEWWDRWLLDRKARIKAREAKRG